MKIFSFHIRTANDVEKKTGYRFKDPALFQRALTHPSYRSENKVTQEDYQRLEFLGDSVLGMLAASWLYLKYPNLKEGWMTAMKTQLTNDKTLAEIGFALGLGAFLRMGRGETRSGGNARPGNIADALEALLGAAYLDGGIKAAEKVFKKVFASRIENIS